MILNEIIDEILVFEKELSAKYKCHISLTFSYNKNSLERIQMCCDRVLVKYFRHQDSIRDRTRTKELVYFRWIYYKLARESSHSYWAMSTFIGTRSHRTVIYGIEELNKILSENGDERHIKKYYQEVQFMLMNIDQ